jgi:hypothetical protein
VAQATFNGVRAASGGASDSRTAPAVMVVAGLPPPSGELAREAPTRRLDGGRWLNNGSSGFDSLGHEEYYL